MHGTAWLNSLSYYTERTDRWKERDLFLSGSLENLQNTESISNSAAIPAAGGRSTAGSRGSGGGARDGASAPSSARSSAVYTGQSRRGLTPREPGGASRGRACH